ncbi:MAG: sigma-54-dependent Fis family transcriptional regulator [Ignavibacteria bacterium]|jgi:DNA-binding NtrC family response regulator|nr:sigma-54-dependent Fis family transcriptional regulator [Ignavibacteria bacterium]MCU7499097.1 sigma-54-dependent Fis family transcriptional regulator [Ignavibacteria bacterium]MCU7521001.1 sigma-54-dependent Fis family transcriptional regulator [Ignavibacteria bacterium]MCU7524240.1 sigma-54-dependent Fis family transcriptional regulator [Ignavibacteria bacterium]
MLSSSLIRVLLIEDEDFDVRRVQNTVKPFEEKIHISKIVSNGKDALEILHDKREKYHVVIMDFQIAGGLMGEALIQKIKEIDSSIQIIVITKMTINLTDFNFANKLLKAGAFWYCTKYPGDIEEYIYQPTDFVISIFNAFEKCLLERERDKSNLKLKRTIEDILAQKKIIGESVLMTRLKEDVLKYSQSNVNILIKGASGTGKEIIAFNLHYNSPRRFENFVPINCGSLPNDLIESELFGYEKGAFTGADKKKPGLFEIANNGTVFLDEITELPLSAQVKLLRVIQEGELEKLGRTEKIKVNVRIIAATNRNIEEEVRAKRFREDLYYRLNVVPISVPPLKQRKSDIHLLIDHFMNKMSIDMGKEKPQIDQSAWEILIDYDWPGNIRELINVVQRFFFSDEKMITYLQAKLVIGSFDLHEQSSGSLNGIEFFTEGEVIPLKQMEKMVREKYFIFVRENSSSDTEAAKKLGLAPPNYYRMAKELGLK